jgi:hypothetical protein
MSLESSAWHRHSWPTTRQSSAPALLDFSRRLSRHEAALLRGKLVGCTQPNDGWSTIEGHGRDRVVRKRRRRLRPMMRLALDATSTSLDCAAPEYPVVTLLHDEGVNVWLVLFRQALWAKWHGSRSQSMMKPRVEHVSWR